MTVCCVCRLVTHQLGVTGPICVDFFYHMYGADMGSLRLSVLLGPEDVVVWSRSGDQGDKWIRHTATYQLRSPRQLVTVY